MNWKALGLESHSPFVWQLNAPPPLTKEQLKIQRKKDRANELRRKLRDSRRVNPALRVNPTSHICKSPTTNSERAPR